MKNCKNRIAILVSIIYFIGMGACKKQESNNTQISEENELITSVSLTLIDSLTNDTINVKWSQIGGPGTAIVVDTLNLKVNSTYTVFTQILDESKSPIFNVSDEIKADANHHRFVYSSSATGISTSILDFDSHIPPMELGLNFKLRTSNLSTGKFNVMLKHYTEDSPKTLGLQAGSTDIDLSFPVEIK
ncbi:MAG: hypothetical protein CFE21_02470 [Bacteroidetes bacterium B1(2017)]|nr:MAG: hypothetical protein CFE21_02470 [Bacteroidetes bacterium B1(2017)]